MPFCTVLTEHQLHRTQGPIIQQTDNSNTTKSLVNSSGAQELRQAASSGNVDLVRELCRKSVPFDADIEGRTALHYAAANGHTVVVKELIASGIPVNAKDALGYTPLLHAATDGHVEVVKLLLKNNANVDIQDDVHCNSALHESSWKGYSQTIEALCKHKADTYLKNKGHSALHLACQQGHNQSCRLLLMTGCKPDIKNNFGDSPLHSAARYGHAGVVRILLSAFSNVNEVNKNGDTALHISAAMGRKKLTRILLEAGCNPIIPNKQGETAMDIALRKSYTDVQEIIANPPPLRIPTVQQTNKDQTKTAKREKESSQGSKDSTEKVRQERFKKTKSGSSRSVHFRDEKSKKINGSCNWSPYGCHMHPNVNDFPKPKLDSLPNDPLTKGEQYYTDLAGNIRKGPVGKSHKCFCGPLLHNVEKKMEKDKRELIDHIDSAHENLTEKICSLEKKTHNQLVTLNEAVKEKLAHERLECNERVQRCALRERIDSQRRQRLQVEQLKGEVKSWLSSKLETHRRSYNENLDQYKNQYHNQNIHYNHNNHNPHYNYHHYRHNHAIERSTSQISVPSVVYNSQQLERPKSSLEPIDCPNARQPKPVSRSKSDMYLTGSGDNSDEETIRDETIDHEIQVTIEVPNDSRPECENITQTENRESEYVQKSLKEDFEKLGARPKEQFRLTTGNTNNEVNVKSDNSGSSPEINDQNRIENINPSINRCISSQDTDHINDINLSADLMKTLRCNGSLHNSGEHGDSPFNDSGYRTKFSPSPREASKPLPHNQNAKPTNFSPPFRNTHPIQQNAYALQHHLHYGAFDPPIGLPQPQPQPPNCVKAFKYPVNIHGLPYNGPNSSLV